MKYALMQVMMVAAMLGGCGAPDQDMPIDTIVTLQPASTIALDRSTSLRFDGVLDTRCPIDVQCVSAGSFDYNFTLSAATGTESFILNRGRPAFDATTIKGTRFILGDNNALPPPRSTTSPPPPAQAVTIRITRH